MEETDGSGGSGGGAVGESGGVPDHPTDGGMPGRPAGVTRPVVLPEMFDGTGSWGDWSFHFENVAAVNGWDNTQKLQWLRVRLTGRAQKALHRLTGTAAASYEATKDALKARFEPESKHTRYQAEFQARRKRANEGWADLADDLRSLADKAYPDLQEEARERLCLNSYLAQLPQPQIAFSVRQKRPTSLDDAVATTIEMESYLPPQTQSAVNLTLPTLEEPPVASVSALDQVAQLTRVVEELAEQVGKLQQRADAERPAVVDSTNSTGRRGPRSWRRECWNCQQPGHIARNCPLRQPQTQPFPQPQQTPPSHQHLQGN